MSYVRMYVICLCHMSYVNVTQLVCHRHRRFGLKGQLLGCRQRLWDHYATAVATDFGGVPLAAVGRRHCQSEITCTVHYTIVWCGVSYIHGGFVVSYKHIFFTTPKVFMIFFWVFTTPKVLARRANSLATDTEGLARRANSLATDTEGFGP
jgi:hypothetical protein